MMSPAPSPGTCLSRAARPRRLALGLLALGLLVGGCTLRAPLGGHQPVDDADLSFESHVVRTGSAGYHAVLPGALLGGASSDLAVVSVEDDGTRRLRVFSLDDGAWSPAIDATLRRGVSFVDVAEIGGRDRLLTYEPGRVSWFDPETKSEELLAWLEIAWGVGDEAVPRLDVTRDLNGDGLDDLVVPDVHGFWIATQEAGGRFSQAVRMGPPEPMRDELVGQLDTDSGYPDASRRYRDVGINPLTAAWYMGRVHAFDHDLDGRVDLAFWNGDGFDVHRQGESGRFAPVATAYATDVPIDLDGAYARAFEYRDDDVGKTLLSFGKKTSRTVLHAIRDLDGDGLEDLVTLTLTGRSIVKQRSVYAVHYGMATADGLRFRSEAGATIRPRGTAGGMQPWGYMTQHFRDLDGDGAVDIAFRGLRVGAGTMIRAMVGHSVPLDLEFFRIADGVVPDEATARLRVLPEMTPFAGEGVFFPAVALGDVDGDGSPDLLAGHNRNELRVWRGVPGDDLFSSRPVAVAAELPNDERNTWLADLDGNGKEDVFMLLGPAADDAAASQRLSVLMAR